MTPTKASVTAAFGSLLATGALVGALLNVSAWAALVWAVVLYVLSGSFARVAKNGDPR